MKKVITMVGTSLFENYLKEKNDDNTVRDYLDDIKDKLADKYDEEIDKVKIIKQHVKNWIDNLRDKEGKENISAEVKSLVKLKEKFEKEFEIHLLCSDTIMGKLAGEILKDFLPQLETFKDPGIYLDTIENLQVEDNLKFKEGMVNLINKIYKIADYNYENVILNITGGYKATIPYLTIVAQVNKIPTYYIFEETDALIEIPYIPLDIKWAIFKDEENKKFFKELEREEVSELPKGLSYREEIKMLIEEVKVNNKTLISFNPLGIALWERYKQSYETFYISDIANEYIEKGHFENIAKKTFFELKRRLETNPQHPDLDHKLVNADIPQDFKCFKHKENDLQVRVLYTKKEWKTSYRSKTLDIYIGLISIGNDVHNVESEYVDYFKRFSQIITNLEEYKEKDYPIDRKGGSL